MLNEHFLTCPRKFYLESHLKNQALTFKRYICEMRRNRVSLGNSSVKTGWVSGFGAEIDSEGGHGRHDWVGNKFIRRPLPLICPITSDQSFDLSARAKCCEDKKEMAGNMGVGWLQLLAADETFTAIIVASDPPSFVQPGLLTPGLCYWGVDQWILRQVWTKPGEELAEGGGWMVWQDKTRKVRREQVRGRWLGESKREPGEFANGGKCLLISEQELGHLG